MKHCPICGTSVADNARFCTKCGKPVSAASTDEEILMSRCPKCGYQPSVPSRFCIQCGTSLVVTTPPKEAQQAAPQNNQPEQPVTQQGETAQQSAPNQPAPNQSVPQDHQQTPPHQQNNTPPYQSTVYYPSGYMQPEMIRALCSRLKVSAILLLITGILQAVGALVMLIVGIALPVAGVGSYHYHHYYGSHYYYEDEVGAIIAVSVMLFMIGAFLLGVCIANLISAGRTFSYIKQIQVSPVGIVQHFASGGKTITLLVFNVLFGGTIGIVGSAFALAARSYVHSNALQFAALEQSVR